MSFVVIGRPPGPKKRQSVRQHRQLVRCNEVPYDTMAAAQELLKLLQAQGWQYLEINRYLGDDDEHIPIYTNRNTRE